jgi:hypothetical protein
VKKIFCQKMAGFYYKVTSFLIKIIQAFGKNLSVNAFPLFSLPYHLPPTHHQISRFSSKFLPIPVFHVFHLKKNNSVVQFTGQIILK